MENYRNGNIPEIIQKGIYQISKIT